MTKSKIYSIKIQEFHCNTHRPKQVFQRKQYRVLSAESQICSLIAYKLGPSFPLLISRTECSLLETAVDNYRMMLDIFETSYCTMSAIFHFPSSWTDRIAVIGLSSSVMSLWPGNRTKKCFSILCFSVSAIILNLWFSRRTVHFRTLRTQ